MSGILNGKDQIMDMILTQKGREALAKGKFKIKYYALHDDEIDYQAQYVDRSQVVSTSTGTLSIAGAVSISGVLASSFSSWNPTPTFQWVRASTLDGGGTYSNILNATASTYVATSADIGYDIALSASNTVGATISNSLRWRVADPGYFIFDLNADYGVEKTSGVAAINGDQISFWRSQTGSNKGAEQITDGFKPIFSASAGPNGHNAIYFMTSGGINGTFMTTFSASVPLYPSSASIFSVVQSPASGRYVYDSSGSLNGKVLFNTAGNWAMYAGNTFTGSAVSVGTWAVIETIWSGTLSRIAVNANNEQIGNPGTAAGGGGNLQIGQPGNFTNSSFNLSSSFARMLIYSGSLSELNRANINAYLLHWSGLG